MRSPFQRRGINLFTFYLEIGGKRTIDPDTGNLILVPATRRACTAYLRQKIEQDNIKTQDLGGIDINEIYLEGYLVSPLEFPSGINFPLICEAEYQGTLGKLKFIAVLPNLFVKSQKKLGQKVRAFFQFQGVS